MRLNLRERPLADDVAREIGKLAGRTRTFSGADLAHLCETAAEAALEASMESGELRPIAAGDLARALKETQPSTRAWFEVAYNYAMFANEGGQYDELLAYIREHRLS